MDRNLAPPFPAVASNVSAFAAERGISEVLPAIVDMTRDVFADRSLTISLGRDADEEPHRYIALDVAVSDMEVDELLEAQRAWSAGLLARCTSPQAVYFVLGWQ